MNGVQLQDYSNRMFTYYTSNLATNNNVTTPWGSENLSTQYGGGEISEYDANNGHGFVKTETINTGCAGCGGSVGGMTRTYHYMSLNGGSSTDHNEVIQLVIEDTEDASSNEYSRMIYGLNKNGVALRQLTLDDDDDYTNYWAESTVLNSDGQVDEFRMPSVHAGEISNDADAKKFLNPYTGSSWSNDTSTASSDSGIVQHYEFDDTDYGDGKQVTGYLVSEGTSGTQYYLAAADWGQGATNQPTHLPLKEHVYPVPVVAANRNVTATRETVEYTYEFFDVAETQLMKTTVAVPAISTANNGSSNATEIEQYFDEYGRLRWDVDGRGYITYYAHHPDLGGVAYVSQDVDPSTSNVSSEIKDGSSGEWDDWLVGDADGNKPTRDTSLPPKLAITSKQFFDDLGRMEKRQLADENPTYTVYQNNRTIRFPYWDSTSNESLLPISVSSFDDGGTPTESFSLAGDASTVTHSSNVPTGIGTPSKSDYVFWTRYFHDEVNGRRVKTLRYHDIPASGNGGHLTNYYVTSTSYDDMGRKEKTISSSEASHEQVRQYVYDVLNRVIETKQGTGSSGFNSSADATLGALSALTLRTITKTEFDDDSRVTHSKRYFDVGANDYIDTEYVRTWRGHIRGLVFSNHTAEIKPYKAYDIDWMGRTTAEATYTNEPDWTTMLNDPYDDYIGTDSSGRNDWVKTYFDEVGRVYKTESHFGNEATKFFRTNNYYDENGNLVATGDEHGGHQEYAYDALGRRYQSRIVDDVDATPFNGEAFDYRNPDPHPSLSTMDSTAISENDGLISFSHIVFDEFGNAEEVHQFELNHTDTDGIDLASTTSFVRTTAFRWFDDAHRVTTIANYGSGAGTATPAEWKYVAAPTRPSTALSWTDSVVYEGYVHLTTNAYNEDSGRLESMKVGVSKNGSNTNTVETGTYYDDLGRRIYLAENRDDFDGTLTTIGDAGTDKSKDRVTAWEYGGLDQVIKLIAYNGSSSLKQETEYEYDDTVIATLVTKTIHPGSVSGSDEVEMTYYVDGKPHTRTDQRGTVITYLYNNRRQQEYQDVTTIGTADPEIKSIKREYDDLARTCKITSFSDVSTGSPTKLNEIEYEYTAGKVTESWQEHDGGKDTSTVSVRYVYDESVDSDNVYDNGFRLESTQYPSGNTIFIDYGTGYSDRLGQTKKLRRNNGSGTVYTEYDYNGEGRLVKLNYPEVDINLDYYRGTAGTYAGFDRFGAIHDQYWEAYSNSAPASQYVYRHDYAGNRVSREDVHANLDLALKEDEFYEYDGLFRLINAERGDLNGGYIGIDNRQLEQDWSLDGQGNWSEFKERDSGASWDIDQDRAYNDVNETGAITGTGNWYDPQHDAAGNMTRGPLHSSLATFQEYVYDAWNRLVKVKDNSGATVAEYEYDGLNRRISKTVSGTSEHYYYNSNYQVLEVRPDTGSSTDPSEEYVWHPHYIDALAVRFVDNDTDGNFTDPSEEQYACFDGNFNISLLIGNKGVVQRYRYTAYGEIRAFDGKSADFNLDGVVDVSDFNIWNANKFKYGDHSQGDANGDGVIDTSDRNLYNMQLGSEQLASSVTSPYTYTGRRFDSESGLYYYRARYYDAKLGRFLSRDPIGFEGSQWNLYEYVNCAPLAWTDPFGLQIALDTVNGSVPQIIAKVIAGEITVAEMAQITGMSVTAAQAAIEAAVTLAAAQKIIERAQAQSKGSNPCEKAISALNQALKSLRSLRKVIKQHNDKIADPTKHMKKWYPHLTRDQNIAKAVNDWQRDISKAETNIKYTEKAIEGLREAVKLACYCWYNPFYDPWNLAEDEIVD
ncbi:MAG: RHS repeat-associated core domain-containing protein [Planctomycetota bacterium]